MSRFEAATLGGILALVLLVALYQLFDFWLLRTDGILQQLYQSGGIHFWLGTVFAVFALNVLNRIAWEVRRARLALELLADEAAAVARAGASNDPVRRMTP